jgi:hypothetical protein
MGIMVAQVTFTPDGPPEMPSNRAGSMLRHTFIYGGASLFA